MQVEILLTANSRGEVDYMPRLFTAIRALKRGLPGKVLLVDSGRGWSDRSWICAATEHRAPYLIMDAMGYDVVFADGLSAENLTKVQAITQTHFAYPDKSHHTDGLHLALRPDEQTDAPYIRDDVLMLPLPPPRQILRISLKDMTISATSVKIVTDNILPDPTIAGTADFVKSEARYYQKTQGSDN